MSTHTTRIASPIGQYAVVTANYWAFTLTDGALRMLVVLYFHQLGFSPLHIAMLFVLYELFGVITNLLGGWIGARLGLHITLQTGLALQIIALSMLLADTSMLTAIYVMATQAISGVAKDLNKMSAKSSVKQLTNAINNTEQKQASLYHWVALLTGSKNALKGVGFFLGGFLLATLEFSGAIIAMIGLLSLTLIASLCLLRKTATQRASKPKFTDIFSNHPAVNYLSGARFFLFGSRDIWFAVALPVFLQSQAGWGHTAIGTTLALWVIFYGAIQALAPRITRQVSPQHARTLLLVWAALLGASVLLVTVIATQLPNQPMLMVIGLFIFGGAFAINSSMHSYLIVAYAREEGASLDVGFYYMANAAGRLIGIILSGLIYQYHGLSACLIASGIFILATMAVSYFLPADNRSRQ
ncbi:organoarsenical effux MFS transporter ArsJ [Eionea flava]